MTSGDPCTLSGWTLFTPSEDVDSLYLWWRGEGNWKSGLGLTSLMIYWGERSCLLRVWRKSSMSLIKSSLLLDTRWKPYYCWISCQSWLEQDFGCCLRKGISGLQYLSSVISHHERGDHASLPTVWCCTTTALMFTYSIYVFFCVTFAKSMSTYS